MNLVMVSIFLLAMLVFQPTLIYGTKGLTSTIYRKNGNGKKHSALSSSAKLKLSLENGGDVLVRSSRGVGDTMGPVLPPAVSESGALNANAPLSSATSSSSTSTVGGGASAAGGKRGKNNNRKSNKNISTENVSSSNGGRKHLDKKYTAAANQEQQQQLLHHLNQHQYLQQQQHHHERQHQHSTDNNKNKQRQFLKSQQHQHQQNHNKRSGIKAKTGAATSAADEKTTNGEKPTQSTCRYAKSPWSDCDSKTNMRTRTLTLKKGEENCLPTRTMQKKCKKQCRYDKGSWSECNNGQMTRQDKLKSTGNIVTDATCEAVRSINKKCNPNGAGAGKQHRHQLGVGNKNGSSKERKNKDKASRRATLPPKAA